VLQAICEPRGWDAPGEDDGQRIFVRSRAAIDAGFDVYLNDLRGLDPERHGSLLLLLENLAAKHLEVLIHLRDVLADADGEAKKVLEETFSGALEHAQQHTVEPVDCYCGDAFVLDPSWVAQAAGPTDTSGNCRTLRVPQDHSRVHSSGKR